MDMTQFSVIVMKNVREFVQPAIDALAKRIDDVASALRVEFGEAIKALPQPAEADTSGLAPFALYVGVKEGLDAALARIAQYEKELADCKEESRKLAESVERSFAEMRNVAASDAATSATAAAKSAAELPQQISDLLVEAMKSVRVPKDGVDSDPAAVAAIVLPELRALAAEHLAAIPLPKDGEDGEDGKSITIEDMLPVLESMQTKWALDFERRAQELFQRAIERMPAPKDGKDGLGFDDITLERKDARNYVLRFVRGDQVKEFPIPLPMLVYRGVYKRDADYEVGDLCSWGGHMYHRDEPQGERVIDPDKNGSGWTQCVKRGNDGSSAYASAVKHGFVGSERDWVESIGKAQPPRTVKLGT